MAKKNPVAIETTVFFRGTPERISPPGDKPRIRGAQQKNLPHGRFFVVRPSGFPLSGINLESAAHSKKPASRQVFRGTPERISPFGDKPRIRGAQQKGLPHGRFFRGTPERISPPGDKPRIRGAQQKNLPHGRFFVVRPSGFEPLAYRVGVCHSIQLSYGRIFSRSYYSKVRPKSKAGFSVSIRRRICYTEKKATCIGRTHPL